MRRLLISLSLCLSVVPVLTASVASTAEARRRRSIKRHHITLHNLNTGEKLRKFRIIEASKKNRNRQWVRKRARSKLNHFFRDWRTGKQKRISTRVLWNLYLVAQHYDATIEVVSGYRARARKTSRHYHGNAIDFRVKGVSPKAVWEYCKRFSNVGLGYYPKTQFVHMDARDQSYYWIDRSGRGESARYARGVTQRKQGKHKSRASKRKLKKSRKKVKKSKKKTRKKVKKSKKKTRKKVKKSKKKTRRKVEKSKKKPRKKVKKKARKKSRAKKRNSKRTRASKKRKKVRKSKKKG